MDAVRYQFRSEAIPDLTARSTALAVGRAQAAYTARIEAEGGRAPYRFELATGASGLPAGLALEPATGVLSGTPTQRVRTRSTSSSRMRPAAVSARRSSCVWSSVEQPGRHPRSQPTTSRLERSKDGPLSGAAPDLSSLLSVITALPEGAWSQVGLNSFFRRLGAA